MGPERDHSRRTSTRVRRPRLPPPPPPQNPVHPQLCRYPRDHGPRDARPLPHEPRDVQAEHKNSQSQSGRGGCPSLSHHPHHLTPTIHMDSCARRTRVESSHFQRNARSIHAKASPTDPNFLRVSVAYVSFDPADAETDRRTTGEKRLLENCERMAARGALSALHSLSLCQGLPWEVLTVVEEEVFLSLGLSIGIVYTVLHLTA